MILKKVVLIADQIDNISDSVHCLFSFKVVVLKIAEKKLDLIFLKIVTKNVRKESVLKLIVRGWRQFSADF